VGCVLSPRHTEHDAVWRSGGNIVDTVHLARLGILGAAYFGYGVYGCVVSATFYPMAEVVADESNESRRIVFVGSSYEL
jgi:hypothetical protein